MTAATRPADVLMAAHLDTLAAAERRSAEYVEHNNHAQHFADAEAHRAALAAAVAILGPPIPPMPYEADSQAYNGFEGIA